MDWVCNNLPAFEWILFILHSRIEELNTPAHLLQDVGLQRRKLQHFGRVLRADSLSTFLLHGQLAQGNEADQEGGRRMTLDRVYSGGSRQSCTGQNKMEMMGVAGSDRRSSRMRIDQTRPRQPAMNSKHNLQESLKCEAQQTYPPRNWNIVFCTGSNPDTCAELPRKIISRRSSWLLTLTGR